MRHRVAVVHRPLGLELHDHRLRPDRQRAREHVEPLDRRLQVHDPLPRRVVRALELGAIDDATDPDPLAAVVGLHEQRVADLLGDRGQVERLVVLVRGVLKARVVRRVLVRHEHRLRHLQTEANHRAVGGVLLHRLEGERAVEQIHVVHQRDLLEPLAREVIPVGQPVDDQLVLRPVAEVERLDGDPLGGDPVALAGAVGDRAEPPDQCLERPVASPPRCRAGGRSDGWSRPSSSAEPRQMMRELGAPRWPVVRQRHTPTGRAHTGCPWSGAAREPPGGLERAGGVLPLALPADDQHAELSPQPVEVVAIEVADVVHRVVEVRGVTALAPAVPGGGVVVARTCRSRAGNRSARLSAKLAA